MVIYCRGDIEIHRQCIAVLRRHLAADHPVHIHHFLGGEELASLWSNVFSNLLFSIPLEVLEGRLKHLEAFLQESSITHLVVESDAPYVKCAQSSFCCVEVAGGGGVVYSGHQRPLVEFSNSVPP